MKTILSALALILAPLVFSPQTHANPGVAADTDDQDIETVARERFTVEIRGKITGEGPDVILIPGLATPREVWSETAARLSGEYRVHLVQLRGFGDEAAANANGPVLEPFVEDLAGYIEEHEIKRPAVIGHSMGGLSAAMLASRHPDLPGRILIEDSLPFFGLIFSPYATVEMVQAQASAMRKAVLAAGEAVPDEQTLARMSATEEGRRQVGKWGETADYRVVAQATYDVLTTDIRPELENITVPTTLVYPYDEAVGSVERVDELYRDAYEPLSGIEFQRIENSRHFITLDQPAAFAAAVDAFLEGHGE